MDMPVPVPSLDPAQPETPPGPAEAAGRQSGSTYPAVLAPLSESQKIPEKKLQQNSVKVPAKLVQKMREWRRDIKIFIRDHFQAELDPWQVEACDHWNAGCIRLALCACKGPGKTAFLSWIIWQFLCTRRQSKVAATSVSG